jgi:peptide chain release factor 1
MKIPKNELKIEWYKGQGPGGQHKNKVATACRITHLPTGIVATADGRHRTQNKREAMTTLQRRLIERNAEIIAAKKKARRDHNIHNMKTIRTYDFKRGTVKDHRTGIVAPLHKVLVKGMIDLLKGKKK